MNHSDVNYSLSINGFALGHGLLVWPHGGKYEGEFLDGLMHGYGVAEMRNGDTCEGEFHEDTLIGTGEGVKDGEPMKCFQYEGGYIGFSQ